MRACSDRFCCLSVANARVHYKLDYVRSEIEFHIQVPTRAWFALALRTGACASSASVSCMSGADIVVFDGGLSVPQENFDYYRQTATPPRTPLKMVYQTFGYVNASACCAGPQLSKTISYKRKFVANGATSISFSDIQGLS